MRTAKFLLSVVACAVCISSAVAFADQMNDGDEDFKPTTRQDDDRLPAVLPGGIFLDGREGGGRPGPLGGERP
jgi:hypothetical protein